MGKRFLAVVRAGNASLHPGWLQMQQQPRNWDLIVNYYGDDPHRYPASADGLMRIDSKGPKWPALARLMNDTREAWQAYDYVWFPDDDLAATGDDINRMFEIAAGLQLHLAQPSLTWDSHVSLAMTLHNPSFSLRYSSFVEPMAPLFSTALLHRAVSTFGETISGWGLDYVWPQMLENPARQCAILDCVQVRHTRPVGGPNYVFNKTAGVEPRAEMVQLLQRYGIPGPIQMSYGGMDKTGRHYALFDPTDESFLSRLCMGYMDLLKKNPNLLGQIFIDHAQARLQFLATQTEQAATAAPAPHPTMSNAAPPNAQPGVQHRAQARAQRDAPLSAQPTAAPQTVEASAVSPWAAALALR